MEVRVEYADFGGSTVDRDALRMGWQAESRKRWAGKNKQMASGQNLGSAGQGKNKQMASGASGQSSRVKMR